LLTIGKGLLALFFEDLLQIPKGKINYNTKSS
jgi:hypothetical protein